MTPTTAAIYARYSSTAQNDASIEQQIAECTAYAQANGLTICGTYEDRAMTGRNDKRPGFQRMIRAAERHEFAVLLAYKSNRIARNMLDALRYEDRLDKAGVKVVYCKENFGDNAAGRLALRMMMSLNEFYSENLSEDVRRGMADSARQCKVVGTIPLGYKRAPDGRFEIDEPAAAIVREIFTRVLNREPYADIARDLNARGIRTQRGRQWTKGSFHVILSNERYTGVYRFADIRIDGGMPQIITPEVFAAVSQIRQDRSHFHGRHRSNNDFLLTGKLFCGHCLSPMVGTSGKGRNGTVHYYYSCNGMRLRKNCTMRNVRKSLIETEVTKAVLSTVLDDDMVEWIADAIMDMAARMESESQIGMLRTQLADTQKQIDNIIRAIEMGVITDEFKARMAQLHDDKVRLQGQIAKADMDLLHVDRPRVIYYLEQVRSGDAGDSEFQHRIVRDFVRAVYLYDDYLKLSVDFTGKNTTYTVPVSGLDTVETEPPQSAYPNHRSNVTAAGRWFVIRWSIKKAPG